MHRPFVFRLLLSAFSFQLSAFLHADLPVPPQVLDPQTAAEAWNVIRLATANVTRLLDEQRLPEVPQQISLCSPALRTLARSAPAPEQRLLLDQHTAAAFRCVNDIAQAAMARLQPGTAAAFARLQATLAALRPAFAPADLSAEIYTCPQHPDYLVTQPEPRCRYCQSVLRVRRIPYTDVCPAQTTPQTQLSLESSPAPAVGRETTLRARLQTAAGQPLALTTLIPLHAAPVRLFLVDQTLTSFHLLTPVADASGQLESAFTPALPGPWRLWAELAPAATALPEYPTADLGGEFKVMDRSQHDFIDALSATVSGIQFQLTFTGGNGGAPPLRQLSLLRLHVSDTTGQPVTRLEPLMQAFAHLTGIYDDGQTLLRLHPVGGDILREDLRGGPWLTFKIYPPRPGYLRLFCQVRIDGRDLTVPLGVNITR